MGSSWGSELLPESISSLWRLEVLRRLSTDSLATVSGAEEVACSKVGAEFCCCKACKAIVEGLGSGGVVVKFNEDAAGIDSGGRGCGGGGGGCAGAGWCSIATCLDRASLRGRYIFQIGR